jgi:acetolactate synthase-1/3 small subunit
LVENKAGVLARIASLFSARGYNIDSLAVGTTERADVSRMTIVVRGDDRVLEQVLKQLDRLVDVIRVMDYRETPHIERDLALIKVKAGADQRSEIMQICDIFRYKIIDVSHETLVIEATGDEDKITALLELLQPFGVLEMSRTGIVAVARGEKALAVKD